MTAFTGRDVSVEFAIALETADPSTLTYQNLGMMRGKSLKASWDTADTTADDSPAFTKQALVTFKAVEFSGDGVSYDDEIFNQDLMEQHVVSPSSATANQPKVWFRMTYPNGKKYEGPFIVSEWSTDAPYSDAVTWKMTAMSNGDVVVTPAP